LCDEMLRRRPVRREGGDVGLLGAGTE